MYSIFDLGFAFIQRFYDSEPAQEEKKRIINEFSDLLLDGWTAEDIIKTLRTFQMKYPGTRPDLYQLFGKVSQTGYNLLYPGCFYYHNQLRIIPGPPKRELDYNTGQIIKIEEPFFLEMRASYTLDNLVDYFIAQFHLDVTIDDRKRYAGGFKYLLKNYNIDTILFMIDAASNYAYSEDMNQRDFNVLQLQDYRTKAEHAIGQKRTENKISGDDRIVPRKRVLTFRGGSSV